jgi:hypothetical protein
LSFDDGNMSKLEYTDLAIESANDHGVNAAVMG